MQLDCCIGMANKLYVTGVQCLFTATVRIANARSQYLRDSSYVNLAIPSDDLTFDNRLFTPVWAWLPTESDPLENLASGTQSV